MIRRWIARLTGNCPHSMVVIDKTPDGAFLVCCKKCLTGWIAPVEAEGISLTVTKSGMAKGCDKCRQFVFDAIQHNPNVEPPDRFDYDCPDCGEGWHLHVQKGEK